MAAQAATVDQAGRGGVPDLSGGLFGQGGDGDTGYETQRRRHRRPRIHRTSGRPLSEKRRAAMVKRVTRMRSRISAFAYGVDGAPGPDVPGPDGAIRRGQ